MSTQAGVYFFDGCPADEAFLARLSAAIAQDGPDGGGQHLSGSVGMVHRAFHTTRESRLETQPYVSNDGDAMTWDGRLDNREELVDELQLHIASGSERTDISIVSAAWERWGTDCFSKFLGDWALSIWDIREQTLVLARDYIGIRQLYYCLRHERVMWCTMLTPLVLLQGTQFTLSDEYIAGYFTSYPEPYLTPYREIHAVPPGKFVLIRSAKAVIYSHWALNTGRHIRYKTDSEYEDHFRHIFRLSVRRRLRSDSPILAELSGGIDSSSIVCLGDDIIAAGEVQTPRLDTISYYDPKEPTADDFLYFPRVEEKRGRTGFHINLEKYGNCFFPDHTQFIGAPSWWPFSPELGSDRLEIMREHGHRVLLSGIGGDEFLGGVPDPRPQLADLFVRFRLLELAKELRAWSLVKRRPWIQLFCQSVILLLPLSIRQLFDRDATVAPWIDARFASKYNLRTRQIGSQGTCRFWMPTQREVEWTFAVMSAQVSAQLPNVDGRREMRFPFLDQQLIEFVASIPQDQILRPGQRRSLMRRSLARFLPSEILTRRTKAVTARKAIVGVEKSWIELENLFVSPASASLGYIRNKHFVSALRAMKHGDASRLVPIVKGICFELWLRDLLKRGLLNVTTGDTLSAEMGLVSSRL